MNQDEKTVHLRLKDNPDITVQLRRSINLWRSSGKSILIGRFFMMGTFRQFVAGLRNKYQRNREMFKYDNLLF